MKKSIVFALCVFLSLWAWGIYQSYRHLYNAVSYLNSNDTPNAIRELRIANRQCPWQIIGRYYEAGLMVKSDPVQALRLYEEVETKHPYFLLTNYFKSLIYKDLRLYDQAYREICKAERLYPLDEVIQKEKKVYKIERSIK